MRQKKYFAELHKEGELADEELSNVNGGCGGGGEIAQAEPLYDPKYKVGNAVWFSKNWYTVSAMTWDQTASAWKYYIVTNSLDKSDSRWVLEGDDDLFDHVPKEYM